MDCSSLLKVCNPNLFGYVTYPVHSSTYLGTSMNLFSAWHIIETVLCGFGIEFASYEE